MCPRFVDRCRTTNNMLGDCYGAAVVEHLSMYCILYCTVLYCTVLYCTVLYCTVLYCTVL